MQLYVKLTIFLLLPVSALNTIVYDLVLPKTVMEKFSFKKLKIEKVIFFTQSPTSISILNFGSCLANCLSFRPFLMLDS